VRGRGGLPGAGGGGPGRDDATLRRARLRQGVQAEQRVRRRAHVGRPRPPARLRRRDQPLQLDPLRIRQAARMLVRCSSVPITIRPHPHRAASNQGGTNGIARPDPQQPVLGQALSFAFTIARQSPARWEETPP
jgi:hypothetical protein